MSNTIPVEYTEPCILHSNRRGFWQCGVWVAKETDATIYPNREEATLVKALRHLNDTEIINVRH